MPHEHFEFVKDRCQSLLFGPVPHGYSGLRRRAAVCEALAAAEILEIHEARTLVGTQAAAFISASVI